VAFNKAIEERGSDMDLSDVPGLADQNLRYTGVATMAVQKEWQKIQKIVNFDYQT